MTAVFCHNATDRSAQTWKDQLESFSSLEFAVSDAASNGTITLAAIKIPRFPWIVSTPGVRHNTWAARACSSVYSCPTVVKGPIFWTSHAREPGGM